MFQSLFEILQFYPLGRSLIHVLDKFTKGTFHNTSNEVIWPKKFKFHARLKKFHFGNFSGRAGMAVPCQCSPLKVIVATEKFFLSWVPMNIQKDWRQNQRWYIFCVNKSDNYSVPPPLIFSAQLLNGPLCRAGAVCSAATRISFNLGIQVHYCLSKLSSLK